MAVLVAVIILLFVSCTVLLLIVKVQVADEERTRNSVYCE
jgi:hypothetical protein